jgi:aminoglycoside 6'-N-acetyltransferase
MGDDTNARRPLAPLHGERSVVRPATVMDADLLVRWHVDPEVARFWDWETFTREQMVERLARPDVDAYVIEIDDKPVGYLQAWFEEGTGVAGLDMFLIPSARGRGIGPDAARTLAGYLLDQGGRGHVTVDPYLWNERAVRGWQNAGFRPVAEHEPDEEHPHRWLLMEYDAKKPEG